MTLDTRAAHAARAVRESVAQAAPVPVGVVVRRHRVSLAGAVVGAAAVAALTIAFAAAIPKSVDEVTPDVADSNRIVPTEITAPVKPEPGPDGSPIGVVDKGYPAPPTDGVAQYNTTSTEFHAYTKFFGAAPVGTVVQATSDYGSASTVVGLTGEFVLKVSFTNAPFNVEFPVVVTFGGETHTFGFTSLWDPADTPISAYKSLGGSTSSSPYEVYYGTAPPGATISASSAYGSGSTTANDKGEWSLKIWFSGAPSGQPFTVTVNVAGTTFPFSYTWTQAPAPTSVSVLWMHKDEGQGQWMKFGISGPAGTVVQATSPYGSASITLQGKPEEHLKVFFSGAPLGEAFPVTLKVNGATFGSAYTFTSSWDPANTPISFEVHKDQQHPYIKVYGTAPPGTNLSISGPYGSISGSVGGNGSFTLKLEMKTPYPPVGEPFDITVTVGDVVQVHSFTYQPS
jgi:hypothetical protein